jgi:hypothetical protein
MEHRKPKAVSCKLQAAFIKSYEHGWQRLNIHGAIVSRDQQNPCASG